MKKILSLFIFLFIAISGILAQSNSATLTGTASDPDGDSMTYLWSEVSGPACTIASPTSISTPVNGLLVGLYTFKFTATDVWGAATSSTMTVTVSQNHAPISNAGPNQIIRLVGTAPATSMIENKNDSATVAVTIK